MKPTRRKIKTAIKKADLVSMNDSEMVIVKYHLVDDAKIVLKIRHRGLPGCETFDYTWNDLLNGELSRNGAELIVPDGTNLRFYKLVPIQLN
jgi:hypothetical protein